MSCRSSSTSCAATCPSLVRARRCRRRWRITCPGNVAGCRCGPGLTCHWQVQGRNQIGFDEWMYLDMQYVDHSSIRTDLRLVAQTIPVVVTGQGAS